MRYLVVIEKEEHNYSAFLPDLPGCVATGETVEETKTNIRAVIEMHLRGIREDGLPVPAPTATAEYLVMQETSQQSRSAVVRDEFSQRSPKRVQLRASRRFGRTIMLAIELPADIDARLERLVRKTGRSKADYVREAVLEYLDEWEEGASVEEESVDETDEVLGDSELMDAIRKAGQEEERDQGVSWEEAKQRMGL